MKLNGTHKFKAPSTQVYNAILNPQVLQANIPGCNSIEYLNENQIQANITPPIPGLKGPYALVIDITKREAPHDLELQVKRQSRGGSIDATSQIHLTDEVDGALLSYSANAALSGAIAIADNPISQGIVKRSLASFFTGVEKAIS